MGNNKRQGQKGLRGFFPICLSAKDMCQAVQILLALTTWKLK